MRRKKVLTLISGIIAIMSIFFASQPVMADSHTQYRYANILSKRINEDWSVYLYQEFNFDGDGGHDLNGQCSEPGIVYSGLAKWFDLSLAYVRYYGKSETGWPAENIPYVAGTLKWETFGIDMSNKMRFEYDDHRKSDDHWRYHNFYIFTPPIKLTRLELQPFLGDEMIYDFDEEYLTVNELRMGISFKITQHWRGSVYYMRAMSHSNAPDDSHWKTTPIVALETSVSF